MAHSYAQHGLARSQQQYPMTQIPSSGTAYSPLDSAYPHSPQETNTGNSQQLITMQQQHGKSTVPLLLNTNAMPQLHGTQYSPPHSPKSSIRSRRDTASSPYLSKTSAFLSIWLPFTVLALILVGMWGLTIATHLQKDRVLEVRSHRFYDFAVNNPTRFLTLFTLISSIIKAIILACFGHAILYYTRYRLCFGGALPLKVLSALSYARVGGFPTFSQAISSKRGWVCLFFWSLFLATTATINAIISPIRTTIQQDISATEVDMTSPSFASFYQMMARGEGYDNLYYKCQTWESIRGIATHPCPGGSTFIAAVYAGRAHFESEELRQPNYVRLGPITYLGTTGGTYPFTSFSSSQFENTFNSTLRHYPTGKQNYTIALTTQGLRVNVSCAYAESSPLSMDPSVLTGTLLLACNPSDAVAQTGTDLNSPGHYPYQNITCLVTPFSISQNSAFQSNDNGTSVTLKAANISVTGQYPQVMVEKVLNGVLQIMNLYAQNLYNNLIAEQFLHISAEYYNAGYEVWPLIAQRQLEGMFAFLASYERVIAESRTKGNPTISRTRQHGQLKYDAFAYHADGYNYLRLMPITITCLLGMWIFFHSSALRNIPRFDPFNSTSLITAAATGIPPGLLLEEAAIRGAAPEDEQAGKTYVKFDEDHDTGRWALRRRQ